MSNPYTKRSLLLADQVWSGQCVSCGIEVEAKRHKLNVHTDYDKMIEKAKADCGNCNKPNAVIFYPKSEA